MQMLAGQEIWREAQPSVRVSASSSMAGEVSCPGRLLAYLSPRSAAGAADGSLSSQPTLFSFVIPAEW